MVDSDPSSRSRAGVSVIELSPTAWRVQGRRRTDDEVPVLIGFVQKFGDVFEVMDVTRPLERAYVATMASAVASITGGTVTQ